jgi:hypothetical protein
MAAAAREAAVRQAANKQLDSIQHAVQSLKEVSYDKWKQQLERQAYAHGWPTNILDLQADEYDANDDAELEVTLNVRNAFMIIMNKTDGHDVEHLLEDCPQGNAQRAFRTVHNYFHRNSQSGKTAAYQAFFTASMSKSDCNIVQWPAIILRKAKALREAGGQADESAQISVLLGGLLPEFKPISLILNQQENLTMATATKTLVDFAQTERLEHLTKGGGRNVQNNTFSVNAPSSPHHEECRNWRRGKCRFGDTCRFKHVGPGNSLPPWTTNSKKYDPSASTTSRARATQKIPDEPLKPTSPPSSTFMVGGRRKGKVICNYCNGDHHMKDCPVVKASNDSDRGPDYIFLTQPHGDLRATSTLNTWVTALFTLIVAAILFLPNALVSASTKVFQFACRSPYKIAFLAIILVARSYVTIADALRCERAAVQYQSFYNDDLRPADCTTDEYEWVSDSGTNRFVTNDKSDLIQHLIVYQSTVVAVGGGHVTSPCYGPVIIESLDHGCKIFCKDVLYIPQCSKKLTPVSTFVRKGCSIQMNDYDKVNLHANDGTPMLSGRESGGLYYFRCQTVHNSTVVSPTDGEQSYFGLPLGKTVTTVAQRTQEFANQLMEAHYAFGHLHMDKLRKLLGLGKGENPDCTICSMANSRRSALSKQKCDRSTRVNHRIHVDIGFTRNSEVCFQLYVDDYTRASYLDVLESKSDCFSSWIDLQKHLENKHAPWKIAFLRTDSEPLYTTPQWENHCSDTGIKHEYSSRYRHDQNGVAERAMQAIGVPFRCMMIQGCAPQADIPDALQHANVIRNHSPTKSNDGRTPREKETGMKLPPNKRLLRGPLFCLVFAHVYEQERNKHAPRGIPCVYLGYDDVNNAYKVKEWTSGLKYFTADVTFHPNTFPYQANPNRDRKWLQQYNGLAPHLDVEIGENPRAGEGNDQPQRRSQRQRGYQFSDGTAIRDIPDVDVPPEQNVDNYMVHSFGPDPTTWEEALGSKYANEWIQADLAERAQFDYHNAYSLVPRADAKGKRIFKPKPVFKIKVNPPTEEHPHGSIEKFKVRMTIAAYTKSLIQGIDYAEKYASTVRWNSIKIIIAIAVQRDLDIVLYDISSFFLYGEMVDTMYMEQPPGWEPHDKPREDFICKVNRTIYGCPQASHRAQKKLKATLTAGNMFKSTAADDCIFVNQDPSKYAALGTHVDDMVGIGDEKGLQDIQETLESEFSITVKRNPAIVTGVEIERNRLARWLKLHQATYSAKLLEEYGMMDCNPATTPIDPATARALMLLPTADDPDPNILKEFQKLMGRLMWIHKTRPDFHLLLNVFSRFLKNATAQHLTYLRGRPLRYLKGTLNYGIVFQPGTEQWVLAGASDADLAGDLQTSRSTSSYFAKLGEFGAVVCRSSLERKISTSTGQAETYAMQSLVKEVVWARQLLDALRFPQPNPTTLLTDNDGVFKQSTKSINHTTAKHYRIAQAYIRSKVDDGTAKVNRVETSRNPADLGTKALHAPLFCRHRDTIMGPQSPVADN